MRRRADPAGEIGTRRHPVAGTLKHFPKFLLKVGAHVDLLSGSSCRRRAIARACCDFTVPTEQPRAYAVSTSVAELTRIRCTKRLVIKLSPEREMPDQKGKRAAQIQLWPGSHCGNASRIVPGSLLNPLIACGRDPLGR